MTDEKKLLSIEAIDYGNVVLDRQAMWDKHGEKNIGEALVKEGNNGKTHGQKGHRKAYLAFEFDIAGQLKDIKVTVAATGETFSFF